MELRHATKEAALVLWWHIHSQIRANLSLDPVHEHESSSDTTITPGLVRVSLRDGQFGALLEERDCTNLAVALYLNRLGKGRIAQDW
jgi:hypothetical protein